jgi:hypothetical protein
MKLESLRRGASIAAAAVVALAVGVAASAGVPSYLGAWKIDSAVVAPWADPAVRRPDVHERDAMVGKTVVLQPGAITGVRQLTCKGPHYHLTDYTADMLFQGGLDELHQANPKLSTAKLAAGLGFTGASWKTLETGCEIDWHFVGPTTAKIGLNDYVYTLTKR